MKAQKMNNFRKNFIYAILTAVFGLALVALPSSAVAQSTAPIDVDFETHPLFDVGNFLPGDSISKTVTVTNQSDTARDVEVASDKVSDDDDLGDILDITIDIPGESPYTNTLANFLESGDVYLSTLSAGDEITYTFTVEFEDTDDNSYQGKTLGFDLCVGFSGEQFSCSEVTDDNNNNDGGGDGNDDNEDDDVGRGGGGPNTITSSSDDPDDDPDGDGDVAGVSTTTQPDLASLLDDLENALRGLLGSLDTAPKVAGAQDSPGLPNTGDDGRSVQLIAVLLSLLATGILAYRIIGRIYRRIRS